ncbi:MAG: hypothetical protein M1814_002678 [Vezdaea aestivalis]|nr:MAG: hypothetical protein M1814_002678 [Vezdaea aestivalis]
MNPAHEISYQSPFVEDQQNPSLKRKANGSAPPPLSTADAPTKRQKKAVIDDVHTHSSPRQQSPGFKGGDLTAQMYGDGSVSEYDDDVSVRSVRSNGGFRGGDLTSQMYDGLTDDEGSEYAAGGPNDDDAMEITESQPSDKTPKPTADPPSTTKRRSSLFDPITQETMEAARVAVYPWLEKHTWSTMPRPAKRKEQSSEITLKEFLSKPKMKSDDEPSTKGSLSHGIILHVNGSEGMEVDAASKSPEGLNAVKESAEISETRKNPFASLAKKSGPSPSPSESLAEQSDPMSELYETLAARKTITPSNMDKKSTDTPKTYNNPFTKLAEKPTGINGNSLGSKQ